MMPSETTMLTIPCHYRLLGFFFNRTGKLHVNMSLSPYYYKVDDSCPKLPNLRQLFDLFEKDTYYIYSFPLKRAK